METKEQLNEKYAEEQNKRMKNKIMEEYWQDVSGYEGFYQVSNLGKIKGVKRGIILKGTKDKDGYITVGLCKKGAQKTYRVHKLVLLTFIGDSDLQIDHINGIKDDNRLVNLRYCTNRENIHFYRNSVVSSSKYIGVSWKNSSKMWESHISINNTNFYLGSFYDEIEASEVYNKALKNWEKDRKLPEIQIKSFTSDIKGVHFCKKSSKWIATLYIERIPYYLGSFDSEQRASEVYSECLDRWINNNEIPIKKATLKTSTYKGVYYIKDKDKWGAQNKSKYLGLFDTEEEAYRISSVAQEKEKIVKIILDFKNKYNSKLREMSRFKLTKTVNEENRLILESKVDAIQELLNKLSPKD